MNSILIYLLQSSVSLVIFYFFYELLFKRDAFFAFNRYYLLFAIFLSSLLPFIDFNLTNLISPSSEPVFTLAPIYSLFKYTLGEVTIYGSKSEAASSLASAYPNSFFSYIILIYFIGVTVALMRFISKLYQIARLLQKSKVISKDGLHLIFTMQGSPAFSFFNYVFIDKSIIKKDADIEKIIEHEKIHIDQKHSLDLIIAELFAIVQWYNPLVYLLKKTLKENHEFIADSDVLAVYPDILSYTKLLINNSTIIKTNILTHNFSYSLLKRRLFMIKKTKNPIWFSFKLIWVLLALTMVIFACSGPLQNNNDSSDTKYLADIETEIHQDSISMATFTDIDHDSVQFLIMLGKERSTKLELFNEKGELIKNFMIGKHRDGAYVSTWKPVDNESVPEGNYNYTLTADGKEYHGVFSIPSKPKRNANTSKGEVFTVVEAMPEYPGGMSELVKYLSNNIKYPAEALKNGVSGRVFVNFIVGKDGDVFDAKVLRGIGSGCDEEAIRVVENMPKWKPGIQRGQFVNVSYNLPIKFALDEKESDTIFKVAEVMPKFPGGEKKMMSYLGNNIKYPETAKKNGVKGRVFIIFIVEKDGSISDVGLLRGIGSGCDEEAMRVIRAMPKWSPGMSDGEPVRVLYNLPIKFALN